MTATAAVQKTFSRPPAGLLAARAVSHEGLAALDRIGSIVRLRRDETLFFDGDAAEFCFKVLEGSMRCCKLLPDGRRHISEFLMQGDFVGFETDGACRFTVEAVTDVVLLRYPRRGVERLMQQDPRLGKQVLGLVCNGLCAAQQQMLLLGRKNAVERIASFLLMMADRSGETDRVELPMTRSDIADFLGLTMETVSRTLGQLKGDGVIRFKGSSEVIIDHHDTLQDIAEAA